MKKFLFLPVSLLALNFSSTNGYDIRTDKIKHPTAYITSMCYTKTKEADGIHNPCFACHINSKTPNYVNDFYLQSSTAGSFPADSIKNPFSNLFKNYSQKIKTVSDSFIKHYVNTSNYFDKNNNIILAKKLKHLPKEWDYNGNGKWEGYIPDCYYHFDKDGFDTRKGKYTGWAAFAYMPFLGTFWPTNGSTDDVLIRLDKPFRTFKGKFDKETYKINLAIVESLIKRQNVKIDKTDEKKWGVDLNKDGKIDTADFVKYDFAPLKNRYMSFVGDAKNIKAIAGLYPLNTEFLHSVRYIKTNPVSLAPRMKELRYAKKTLWMNYSTLHNKAQATYIDDTIDTDRLEIFTGNIETGLSNGYGWMYQGFIEDKNGNLRPQSREETLNCMGCHSKIGATTDTTYAFPRKLSSFSAFNRGWYHWTQKGLKGTPEPRYKDGTFEYSNYLKLNHSGNEFRTNEEVYNKFFDKKGNPKPAAFDILHTDVTYLLNPSQKRAVMLNKAYYLIVQEQSFTEGRTAHIKPLINVYKQIPLDYSTGIKKPYLIPR